MPVSPCCILSCEHARRAVPAAARACFQDAGAILRSHRGWDPGAATLCRDLARRLGCPALYGRWTRLLVDLNRSPGNPTLWSEFSRRLPADQRQFWLAHHHAYHARVVAAINAALASGQTVRHLSVHSCTPVWEGRERQLDIGLLYDPARPAEVAFCHAWEHLLRQRLPGLRIRHNEPYRGTDDGLTTRLRNTFAADRYAGIEIEVNQRLPLRGGAAWQDLRAGVADTLAHLLESP